MIAVENTWTFRSDTYTQKRLSATAKLNWFALSSVVRLEVARQVIDESITFNDRWFLVTGVVGHETKDFFVVQDKANRPFETDPLGHFMIRYEMNQDYVEYERAVYSVLDWLGDIGGLNEAFSSIILLILVSV